MFNSNALTMAAAIAIAAALPIAPAHADNAAMAALPAPLPEQLYAQLDSEYDRVIADLIRITETPAPPFKERARAELFAAMLRDAGLRAFSIHSGS